MAGAIAMPGSKLEVVCWSAPTVGENLAVDDELGARGLGNPDGAFCGSGGAGRPPSSWALANGPIR